MLARLLLRVAIDKGLNDVEDLVLLAAREFAYGFEELTGAADRSGSGALGSGFTEKLGSGKPEGLGKLGDRVGAHGLGFAFPLGDGLLANAEFVGELDLGKASLFAQASEAVTKTGAGMFSRSATRMHGGIIRGKRSGEGLSNKCRAHDTIISL